MTDKPQTLDLTITLEVDEPDISKYVAVVPDGSGAGIAGLIENNPL